MKREKILVLSGFPATGTSLKTEVEVSYKVLVNKLGLPNAINDGYKVDAEWLIYTQHGIATVYNYEDGKHYCGKEGLPVREITNWHIGAANDEAAKEVKEYLLKDAEMLNRVLKIICLLTK